MREPPGADEVGRPRRWWLAFVLNLLFPPTGYAYVGAWGAVWATCLAIPLATLALDEWTLLRPPGVYAFGAQGMLAGGLVCVLLLGAHAAWLATRAFPRHGPSRAVTYIVPWIALIVVNLILRAYWPYPVYAASSEAMQPTFAREDLVLVEGARALCGESEVKAGDAVIHHRGPAAFLHRAVAGPGQTVAMSDGVLSIDGKPVGRRVVGPATTPGVVVPVTEVEETLSNGVRYRTYDMGPNGAADRIAPTTVPAGSWYLLGDSRDNSEDSREFGPVKATDICAVALKTVTHKDPSRVGQKP